MNETTLPLYPGMGFPAVPAGGVSELPRPMQEEVMAEPVSEEREHTHTHAHTHARARERVTCPLKREHGNRLSRKKCH